MAPNFHLGEQVESVTQRAPLDGAHVLVTRPVMPASRTAQRLAALGATPYVFPTIIIEAPRDPMPLKKALASISGYHAAVFVSPSAAEMVIAPFGAAPTKLPASLKIFAPGPGTAEELQLRGVMRVFIPKSSFDSEGLLALDEFQEKAISGKHIAIFRGNDGREFLREELSKRGAQVDIVTAYHRRPPNTPPTGLIELLQQKKVNAISAMSSDAVQNLVALIPTIERDTLLFDIALYASHPRIAETATRLGFRRVVEATAGDAGLIAALLRQA